MSNATNTTAVTTLSKGPDHISFVSDRVSLTTRIVNSKGGRWTETTEQARERLWGLMQDGWRMVASYSV